MAKLLLLLLSLLGVVVISQGQWSVPSPKGQTSPSASSESEGLGRLRSFDYHAGVSDDEDDPEEMDSDDDTEDDDDLAEKIAEKKTGGVSELFDFPLEDLDEDELEMVLSLDDEVFVNEADEHVALMMLKDRLSQHSKSGQGPLQRRKRWAHLVSRAAIAVGRALFRRFRHTHNTRMRSRVTRHYSGRGTYQDAARDFDSLNPTGVTSFTKGRISGRSGQMGRHRVTVRDGSSRNSRPTLEVHSHNGRLRRKFRYESEGSP